MQLSGNMEVPAHMLGEWLCPDVIADGFELRASLSGGNTRVRGRVVDLTDARHVMVKDRGYMAIAHVLYEDGSEQHTRSHIGIIFTRKGVRVLSKPRTEAQIRQRAAAQGRRVY